MEPLFVIALSALLVTKLGVLALVCGYLAVT